MLAILTALSGEQFALAASIPLSPRLAGRDLLLFATTPESNISSLDPLLSTPRARPTPAPDLPDEPRFLYSYAGPSSHGSERASPPPGGLFAPALDSPASPVSRYATPENRTPNGHSLGTVLDPGRLPPSTAPEPYTGRPSIDTIRSWASTVDTARAVRHPSPGTPEPSVVTPRISLDPQAWGAQRKKGPDGSHSPEAFSNIETHRRPAAISPLVYDSVGLGAAPGPSRELRDADLVRQASDASRTSRSTATSSQSRSTADSARLRSDLRTPSIHASGANGHRDGRDGERERHRERKSKAREREREREPNRAPGSRRTRTSIAASDSGQAP